ncbi:MAG: hypothetical protein KDA59_15310 [Planctomycetales bacterium]|nr:hypothetical protein [Planctomycetales bacterium]
MSEHENFGPIPIDAAQVADSTPVKRGRFGQYGLRTLLVVLTLVAMISAYVGHQKPTAVLVHYEAGLVDADLLRLIAARHQVQVNEDRQYDWFVNDGTPLALRQSRGQIRFETPGCVTLFEKRILVNTWPTQLDNGLYVLPAQIPSPASDTPRAETHLGNLGLNFGCRRLGSQVQFRVRGQVLHTTTHLHQDEPLRTGRRLERDLAYDGPLPNEPLVFFAKMDDTRYHVVVVRVTEQRSLASLGTLTDFLQRLTHPPSARLA